jgi:hypothetical protein
MGLIRPIAIERATAVLHSRDADGPLRSMGMASNDHDRQPVEQGEPRGGNERIASKSSGVASPRGLPTEMIWLYRNDLQAKAQIPIEPDHFYRQFPRTRSSYI